MLVIKMKSEGMLCASPGEETIGGGGGGFAPEFESDEFDIGSELEEYKTEI